ncbi:MAG: hypothetical protein IM585_00885 [Pseudanabaena sp. M135S2SP2A07QC]|nr:hypothetical protein [Pseudanabaena sp. M090S1SP2A07QC]MCA6505762.1 hypothetical protein [Pseudanabaena sp. M172S2SP2A07QC]MCA6521894.1 hypothetical protein [Pseudanabaena sp. M051S1SP2A07QC]MCA6524525.1 hypothetical protein [Pseudanabaena sp. M179S2SP2A07QC]MCA6528541.1 hypothetical protein [Pseudanabaena sp. M125S2SP2A07QC]MCA6534466.1 hypothetical protein [Pseudanabaena sp. M176S2SP2A07QC]MCA6539433.1 hypothetical protein [Pseudanabaena sp. M037S2SP2A07QC]MCA6544631.1 hypothetical prot
MSSLLPYLAIAQVVPPTPANTQILNRASGTYVDPNNPLIPINATSNTVTVTVAEVAGITNVPAGIIDVNGGSVSLGDVVNFDFLVTNTGNAPSNIVFPAVANITTVGLSTAPGPGTLQYQLDLNNDGDFADAGEALQAGAFTTTTPIPAGSSVRVRVVGTVTAAAAGAPVSVRLGDTGANDNTAGTQNQPDSGAEPPLTTGTDPVAGAAGSEGEIRTVNVAPDAPVNGEREASAIQATTVATAVRNIALATILKARASYDPGVANTLIDDRLTYRLNLRVAATSPNPAQFTPTALEGTTVNVNGGNQTRILISDVIPAGTTIDSTFDAAANLPAGWQAVYQYAPPTAAATIPIVSAVGGALPAAAWLTTAPDAGTAPNVVRVGYIFTGTLAPGFTTELVANAFQFRVVTTGLAGGGVVNNIAQIFGETVGDPTNRVIYDESGDQNPNNFEGAIPPAPEGSLFTPNGATPDNGVPNPATQDTDNNNNNTGTGSGGEVNIFPIVPTGGILNGPNNVPGAIGRTDNNDDFTNRSTGLTAPQSIPGEPVGVLFDPPPIIFNNTFQNPPSNTTNLDTVRLLPLPPSDLSVPLASRQPNGDIPDGTRVTITFGTQIASYVYNAGVYNFDPNPLVSSGLLPGSQSVLVNGLAPGVLNNYTVTLDLPLGPQNTLLSVDRFVTAEAATPGTGASRAGFNVPIVAFVDSDIDGNFDFSATPPNDAIFNITIDRGYTGYVRLRKQSQVLQGTNPRPVIAPNSTLDELAKTAEPGNIVRYVVEYVNFSTPLAGAGSVVLDAANLVITENGATAPNNWAGVSLHFNNPAVVGGFAQNTFATQGTVTYDGAAIPDPATGTAITTYVNNVGTIQPATNPAIFQGVFRFHRQLQ